MKAALILVAGLVALAATPAASAELRMALTSPTGLAPYDAPVDVLVTVTLSCQEVILAAASAGAATVPVTIDAGISPAVADISGPGPIEFAVTDCATTPLEDISVTGVVGVTPTNATMGLETLFVEVLATYGSPTGPVAGSSSAMQTELVYAYGGDAQVVAPMPERASGPRSEIPYELKAKNFANAKTKINCELVGDAPPGWVIIMPQPMVLDGRGGPKAAGTSVLTISTPHHNGPNNERIEFEIIAKPEAADDGTFKGEPIHIKLAAEVHGVYVPAFPTQWLAVGLLGLATFARRR